MARVKLSAGAEIDLLTQQELNSSLASQVQDYELQKIRGVKWMRLPETLTGKASGGALSLGESSGQICGPRLGYAWSVKRLVVSGLTAGASPDVVNIYRGTGAGVPLWQVNGNNFGVTFGKLEFVLMGGENLAIANVGAFAATGTITVGGELIEVPAELLGKLA